MQQALSQFRTNIERARTLVAINQALGTRTTGALDSSDILRSAMVMAVSALDYYVHEIVRLGMLEIHAGRLPETNEYLRFNVSLESVHQGLRNPTDEQWLDSEIRKRHGWLSFENPDRIADAVRLVSDVKLWDVVAANMGPTSTEVRQTLALIVDRRNKIAHEADIDPSYPGVRWPIDPQMVNEVVSFVQQVVEAIHQAITWVKDQN